MSLKPPLLSPRYRLGSEQSNFSPSAYAAMSEGFAPKALTKMSSTPSLLKSKNQAQYAFDGAVIPSFGATSSNVPSPLLWYSRFGSLKFETQKSGSRSPS